MEGIRSKEGQQFESLDASLRDIIVRCHEVALQRHPELDGVPVEVTDAEKYPVLRKTGGFARHQGLTGTDKPQIFFARYGVDHYEMLLRERPISSHMAAEILGVAIEDLSPTLLAEFIFLHELGHGKYYLTVMPDYAEYSEKRRRDLESLPVPGYNPVRLLQRLENPDDPLSKWFEEHRQYFRLRYGCETTQDLVFLQERSYHLLDTELFPDQFAKNIIEIY